MKANELRIGNWILIPYQNSPIAIPAHETQVQGITIFGEILTNNTPEHEGLKTHYNHVSGIPLTKEWLLKLGFEKVIHAYVMGIHNRIFSGLMKFQFDRLLQMWVFSVGKYKDITRIEYVHQLQNLYFALTGDELEIKE
jgi:hypothetical protein